MAKLKAFFAGVKKELKRVRWPKKKELIKNSAATIVFVVVFAIFFYGVDLVAALIEILVK